MSVVNEPKLKNPLLMAIREQLEHRALWMYLLCDEAKKKGYTMSTLLTEESFKRLAERFSFGAVEEKRLSVHEPMIWHMTNRRTAPGFIQDTGWDSGWLRVWHCCFSIMPRSSGICLSCSWFCSPQWSARFRNIPIPEFLFCS